MPVINRVLNRAGLAVEEDVFAKALLNSCVKALACCLCYVTAFV